MLEKIKEILVDVTGDENASASQNLLEDKILNSFAIINLISELEEEFDVEIFANEIVEENFKNALTIEKMIERLAD